MATTKLTSLTKSKGRIRWSTELQEMKIAVISLLKTAEPI